MDLGCLGFGRIVRSSLGLAMLVGPKDSANALAKPMGMVRALVKPMD